MTILATVVLACIAIAAVLLTGTDLSHPVQAASSDSSPSVTKTNPITAPNDVDTALVITGTGFAAVPTVTLGSTQLEDVSWVSTERLTATVPWGLEPAVYTLTVTNPGGEASSLADAFTVTQGIGVWTTKGPYGGRVRQVALHPVTSTTIYAAVEGVGLFTSMDAADSWALALSNDWPTRIAFDAQDPDVIYYGSDSSRFVRSLDGGATWEMLPELFHSQHGCYRTYPAPHPAAAGVVYVGVGQCAGIPLAPGEGGIYYSTDYGDTWVTRTVGLTDTDIVDVTFHPDDPDQMAATTFSGNVFTTTNGGLTWYQAADLERQLRRIYFNPGGTHEAWIVPHAEYQPPAAPYLLKSTDPGLSTWITVVVTDTLDPGGGVWSMAFRSDAIWAAAERGYTSDDGGATWAPVLGNEGYNPVQAQAFALPPGDAQTIYVGSQMHGIVKSADGGATWQERNQGLAGLQIRELALPAGKIDTIYANTFERGILRSDDGGQAWLELSFFHGGRPKGQLLSADPFVPDRVYLGSGCDRFPCMQISEDAGLTWREVTMTLPLTWAGEMGELMTAVPHPLVPGRLLASVGFYSDTAHCNSQKEPNGFYASDDYGESWTYLGPTPPISEVLNIAYDARDPNLVYAGTQGMGLWKSDDGGASWQAASIPSVLPPIHIADIETHPDLTGTVYVRLYSYAGGPNPQPNLFVSDDAGATWQELPDVDTVFGGIGGIGLVFAPPAPDAAPYSLYTGCDPGLCRSPDGGHTWELVEGAPRPVANSNNPALVAGTDGQRVRLYVGTPGGIATPAGLREPIPGQGQIYGGGVYRYTLTPLQRHWVYLPLVLRQSP
ncbi:MAG: IPT/TIG domain-containing protein [Anaerolineae bacterium]|jgi:hypothetical protein